MSSPEPAREAAPVTPRPPHLRLADRPATGGPLRAERVAGLDELRADWDRLAIATANPFCTWEWAAAWWQVFGSGRELALHALRRPGGEVAAILPLYVAVRRGPVRVVRLIGHGPADQLGPICAPADSPAAYAALGEIAREVAGRTGVLIADRLPGDAPGLDTLGGRALRHEAAPMLGLDAAGWEAWLASRSRNFRDQVRRRERKLKREHRVELELVTDPAAVPAAFERMTELHEARWAGGSRAFGGDRATLHRDFVVRAAERGWARIWLMDVDGTTAAAWYGLRIGDADWYYQAGRRPEFERENVGFVLLCHTMRDAFEAGQREYRFGLGDEPYKARMTDRDPGLVTMAVGEPAASLGVLGVGAAARMPRGLRSRLVRAAG